MLFCKLKVGVNAMDVKTDRHGQYFGDHCRSLSGGEYNVSQENCRPPHLSLDYPYRQVMYVIAFGATLSGDSHLLICLFHFTARIYVIYSCRRNTSACHDAATGAQTNWPTRS
jgi:hypothetical protein